MIVHQVTCGRKGCEKSEALKRVYEVKVDSLEDGYRLPDNWEHIQGVGDLCPACARELCRKTFELQQQFFATPVEK